MHTSRERVIFKLAQGGSEFAAYLSKFDVDIAGMDETENETFNTAPDTIVDKKDGKILYIEHSGDRYQVVG